MRGTRFKYVVYSTREEELYDLAADPHELRSLAADPAHAEQKRALAERLKGLLAEPTHVAAR